MPLEVALVLATGVAAGATAGVLPAVIGQAIAVLGGQPARGQAGPVGLLLALVPPGKLAIVGATLVVTGLVVGVGVLATRRSSSFAAELASALRIALLRVVLAASPRYALERASAVGVGPSPRPPDARATSDVQGLAALQLAITREAGATADFVVSSMLALPQALVTVAVLAVELVTRGAFGVLFGGGVLFLASRLAVERASRRVIDVRGELTRSDTAVFAQLQETLGAIEELRLLGGRGVALSEFAKLARAGADAKRRLATAMAASGQVRVVFAALSPLLVLAGLAASGRAAEPGEVATLLLYVPLLIGRLEVLDGVRQGFVERGPSLDAMRALLELPESPSRPASPRRLAPRARGELTFEGVRFTPPGASAPVLDGVSFRVPAGATVGVCGGSGSGKSTLVRLLLRLDEPDEGRILLDGVDLRELEPDDLCALFGVLRQSAQPLERSVRDNLSLGLEPPPDEASMRAALAAVGLDELASSDGRRGLDTLVRRQPPNLSGGEARRLVLARVVLGDAPVRVLDEPEAGLPAATAQDVLRSVKSSSGGVTHLVVTHAPRLLASDFNVLLREGRVVATGTHDELVARSEDYRALLAEEPQA
ncbi:MAG: ABC transporter ATP-binding protein [Deltaproteobacteria bacterium]|nr:ABC transporter ATP-binding protein [Deltaproteobacteria bacterium]